MSEKVGSEGYFGATGRRYRSLCSPFVLAILLAGSILTSASAQEPLRRVTLDQALRMFEENNLELRLVLAERDEAEGLAEQARAYPNPVATLTHEGLSEGDADYSESYFTVSQRLEWPGRRDARIASSDQDSAAAESRVAVERQRLLFEVKRAFLEAASVERQLAAIEEVLAIFRFAEESGRQRLREGDLSGYDVRRLRIERARYENLAATQAIALQNARLRLGSLVLPGSIEEGQRGLVPAASPDGRPPALMVLSEEAALERAFEIRADLHGAEAQVAAAEAALRHVSTFRYPEVTLTGGYKRQSDGLDGYFLGGSLPLPVFDRRQGDVAAAGARVRRGATQLDLVRRTVANDVRIAFSAYLSVLERVDLIRGQLLDGVDDLLRIAQVSYGEGGMSLLELLDAADAYRESQIAVSELTAELWIRYYDLERAMGGFPSTTIALEGQP